MAHEIVFDDLRGINPIAFTGEVPWHGLGQQLTPDSPIEVWAKEAGMDWSIKSGPCMTYEPATEAVITFPERQILYRDDRNIPLSIVSSGYRIVQPTEVLEFFRDLIDDMGFRMNTAGCLFGGKKFWALAEMGASARIMGQDKLDGYLLLATSCDTSLATTAQFTSVRVVCNNTLTIAVDQANVKNAVKVTHSQQFDPKVVKTQLGLAQDSFGAFIEKADVLAQRKVTDREAIDFLVRVVNNLKETDSVDEELINGLEEGQARTTRAMFQLFKGEGKGSHLKSADGTAWGLVNAVTEWTDHHRKTRIEDNRLDSTWFGGGAKMKDRAFAEAVKLAA